MIEQHQQALKKQLWNIANTLRSNMSADDFREYTLGLIFYKYLSEKLNHYTDELLGGIKFSAIDENSEEGKEILEVLQKESLDKLGYFLKPSQLFHVIAEAGVNGQFILDDVCDALHNIEQSAQGAGSTEDFDGLFDELDLNSRKLGNSLTARNKLLVRTLEHVDNIDFHLESSEIDILGDAYEYLIGMFASGEGKKAGEFYTPQMASKLLAKLVTLNNPNLQSVYDPTCGSGSLLLRVAKEADSPDLKFYGQEVNSSTYSLARMNMIMHDIHYSRFDIQNGNTLEEPAHIDMRFSAVVANPPFSMSWSANPQYLNDERFSEYGKLAPKSKADFAFVQHMVHQLDDIGTMAVVLPHGILFRGAAEKHIRQHLIKEKNYVDAVIGLPANIFWGTSIPTCVLVLKKNRKIDDNILFIDASQGFDKGTANNIIRDEDIQRIIEAVSKRQSIDNFAFAATQADIKENDYNLNIPLYIDASPQFHYLQTLKEQLQEYEPEQLSDFIVQQFSYRNDLPEDHFDNTLIVARSKTNQFLVSSKPTDKSKPSDFVFVFNQEDIDTRYLELFFQSNLGQSILSDCAAKSGGVLKITLESLHNNLIAPIPPLDIQQACVESNNAIDNFLKELEGYKKDIIFKPNRSKELLAKVNATLDYVRDTNKIERLLEMIRVGENSVHEFKETFSLDLKRVENDSNYKIKKEGTIEHSSLKTIAAFLNARGGTLFVGVSDDQKISGIERDVNQFHLESVDNFLLHFKNLVKNQIGESFYPFIQIDIEILQSKQVLVVKCTKANQPCFLGKEQHFYVRSPSGATDLIAGKIMWDYLQAHFVNTIKN